MAANTEPLSFALAELVECRTRRGFPMYVGRANGLSVRFVHHAERTNARGERRQIWRLLAQPLEAEL